MTPRSRRARVLTLLLAVGLFAAACGDSDDDAEPADDTAATADTEAATAETEPATEETLAAEGDTVDAVIPPERCEANEAAGTVTYVTSFDFAATAAILDPIVADAEGFFAEMCLDVEIVPGFAPGNAALVAEGQAQMSSAGSFGELVNNNVNGGADLVAVAQYGKTAIEGLVIPADSPVDPDDLAGTLPGTVMGIKGDIPYSLQAMLGLLGVERGSFDEPLLDGFDPIAHLDLGIDALPVYKSNEPNQLDLAGVDYTLIDPLDLDVPSSFGIHFTSQSFLNEHPTAVQDFIRASFRGFQFALDDPETAVDHAFVLIDDAGSFLSREGETFRWSVEGPLVVETTPAGEGIGLLDTERLGAEIDLLTSVGVYDGTPDWQSMIDENVATQLYDGDTLVWPAG